MKTNVKTQAAIIAFVVGCTLFTACKKNTVAPSNTGSAPYNMYMTDAPATIYQQVNVDIIGAQVNSDISGWVALNIHPGVYNLLTLANGKDTLLANGNVVVGHVSQVRLILGENNTVMVNGSVYPLQTPSAEQSGLKLNVDATLMSGQPFNITLDFDAGMSVVNEGNGTYILKPVIRAIVSGNNGGISGSIYPAGSISMVMAISAQADTSVSFSATGSGGFEIQGLATGSYKVIVFPPAPYSVVTFTSISVGPGKITSLGAISLL